VSYVTMDHAGWVERNIAASKRMNLTSKRRVKLNKGWHAAPDTLSPFQARVFDILGIAGGGIYNAPIAWDGIEWFTTMDALQIPWRSGGGLATFDYSQLTMLVFMCHEARIRFDISPHGPQHFLLGFWQRNLDGGISRRHPSLDEAVADFRRWMPADHRIHYGHPVATSEVAEAVPC